MNSLMTVLLLAVFVFGAWKNVPVAQSFMTGAREGMDTALQILPSLFCMLIAVAALRTSGILEEAVALLSPLLQRCGIPADVLPLFLMRPLSGSASLAMAGELMATFGPDSPQGILGAILCASAETLFYVLAVYAGAAGVRKTGYLIPCALLTWLMGGAAAALVWPLAE
ncbi:MAG: spore maturation protein [Clostridia bacterium]|nr:spore maturation protein [Clostridia bacterium]